MIRVGLIPVVAVLLLCPVAGRRQPVRPSGCRKDYPGEIDRRSLGRTHLRLVSRFHGPRDRHGLSCARCGYGRSRRPTTLQRKTCRSSDQARYRGLLPDRTQGPFLFFDATDPNGAIPFKILDASSGRTIYTDATPAIDKPFSSVQIENGGLHLRYTRGVNAPCSIVKDAAGCWSQLVTEGKIPPDMGQTVPFPQVCAASYKETPADDPSIIIYDVEVTIDAAGKARLLSHGPVNCDAMP